MKPRGNVVVLIRAKEYLAKQNKTKQNKTKNSEWWHQPNDRILLWNLAAMLEL